MSRSRVVRRMALLVGFLAVPFISLVPVSAAAATTPGHASTASVSGTRQVQAAPRLPRGARALGAVDPATATTGAVVLKPRDEAAVKAFISLVTNKASAQYHHYLAPGAYAARFGPSQTSIDAVKAALASAGLQVTNVASDGLMVTFTGAASRVESAFHTGLARYRLADGSTGQATTAAVQVPAAIAASVSSVIGLNELVHARPANIRHGSGGGHPAARAATFPHPAGSPTACAAATSAATAFGGLTDDQIAHAYGAFGLYNASHFGAHQHVAVFELEPFLPSDLQTFDTCFYGAAAAANMIANQLTVTQVDGGQPTGPGSGESILDVQDVAGMAPGANIDVYQAPNTTFGSIDEYSQIINNTNAATLDRIVTSSWGLCEQAVQEGEPGIQQAENLLFEQAAAQGQSVFSAAGDTGSNDCNAFRTTSPVSPILSVDDPSSQPYVVAVGGTTIDNATQPPSEHVWNDGAAWGAGGGGISQSWPMPTYQLNSRVPGINDTTAHNNVGAAVAFEQSSDPGQTNPSYAFCQSEAPVGGFEAACRQLPDVSAQADEFTGAITVYSASFGPGDFGWTTIGGTSSATPIWAGLLALINNSGTSPSCTSPGGTGVGFVNPLLYAVASNPAAYAASFNDITAGNNDPYGASSLFPATTGFDMATGLGTPLLTGAGGTAGLAHYLCNMADSGTRPTVSSLSPSLASTSAPSTTVTITGTGFGTAGSPNVAGVQLGGVQFPASAFTVTNPTTIVAEFPPANLLVPPHDTTDGAGGYQLTVTLNDGKTSQPTASSLFEYVDTNGSGTIPAVTSVRAYGGSEAGGNTVDIFGSGFNDSTISSVAFGTVDSSTFTVLSDFHIRAVVPAYSSVNTFCDHNGSSFGTGENASNDICQVQVVVTNAAGSSATSTILPLYEGATTFTAHGVIVAPSGQEAAPQPNEYDYVPTPTITAISTNPADPTTYASEGGGTVVTITGTGFNLATLDWVDVGDPALESSVDANFVSVTGTEIQFVAPGLQLSTEPISVPVSVKTLAGQSDPLDATYAGVPNVTSVLATDGPTTGKNGGPDTGGTGIDITGAGFSQAVGPIGFVDNATPFSLGTQFNYTVNSDTSISTTTVPQNPATVDVEVCSVTACSFNPPADFFFLYPPGNPKVDSVSPTHGPALGGTTVTISGENLGCVTGVFFGNTAAATFSNVQALLDCGSTTQVTATAPPGPIGATVPVKVTTVESDLTGFGRSPSTATFTYQAVAPRFTADSPPSVATVGVPYSYQFRATGAPTPTFSVSFGAVPTGLHLNPVTGVLSGSPTTDGIYHFRVTASNGVSPPAVTPTLTITVIGSNAGYRVATADGQVFPFGADLSYGSEAGHRLNRPIVGMASSPSGHGYWLVASDGGIFQFGDAGWHGSQGGQHLNQPIVGMASTPSGLGYWLVASDGGIFTHGDATFHGSLGGMRLNQPIVGMATTPSGLGYWLVAADGGVFRFGDAVFYGSQGGQHLNAPVVGMAATPTGHGYWLVASDGGVFTHGDAHFFGSSGGAAVTHPVAGMVATATGRGYGMVATNGDVASFGDFALYGSIANNHLTSPAVSITL